MSPAVTSVWTCPQCRRRVPAREPVCHCGYARRSDMPPGPAVDQAALPVDEMGRRIRLGAAVAAGAVVVFISAVVVEEVRRTGVPPARREVRYPALPAMPAKIRPSRPPSTRPVASGPNVTEVLEVSLRRIAAETSELELSYRPFAEACVASAPDGHWLASLKTARLRAGIALRVKGATVDCEAARKSLVARADALKSDLDATENRARTSGMSPGAWRSLRAKYQLEVWGRY